MIEARSIAPLICVNGQIQPPRTCLSLSQACR
jgi:hypothetical protein